MAEIVLADLLAWMPELQPVAPHAGELVREWFQQPVSWAVAARLGTPMLPLLRGGEIVIISPRTLAENGLDFREVVTDLSQTGWPALVLLDVERDTLNLDLPWLALLTSTRASVVEGEMNRLLTEQRGLLYTQGTELGRSLMAALGSGAEPAALASVGAETTGIPMVLVKRGRTAENVQASSGVVANSAVFVLPVDPETDLLLGPWPAGSRAMAALAGERVGEAVATAHRRAELLKPRGKARVAALQTLLLGKDKAGESAALGLPPDGRYRVVVGSSESAIRDGVRGLPEGTLFHDAGQRDGTAIGLIEWTNPVPPAAMRVDRLRPSAEPGLWLALSGETGLQGLREAGTQALFVAQLLQTNAIENRVATFDSSPNLGPYRLLYQLRHDPALLAFIDSTLSAIRDEDKRGILRETLRSYLATGGAGVESAARLGIHRNTLAYRLRRIASLTGRDPADPSTWLAYGLALAADEVVAAAG